MHAYNDIRFLLTKFLEPFLLVDEDDDVEGDSNSTDSGTPPEYSWMDGLIAIEQPLSEERGLLDEATVLSTEGTRQADHVENKKKLEAIRTEFIRSKLLQNREGEIDAGIAGEVDKVLRVSVFCLFLYLNYKWL